MRFVFARLTGGLTTYSTGCGLVLTGSIYFQAIPMDLSSNRIAASNGLRLSFR